MHSAIGIQGKLLVVGGEVVVVLFVVLGRLGVVDVWVGVDWLWWLGFGLLLLLSVVFSLTIITV